MGNSFYDNREISWLKFNQRVLEEAQDKSTPLFERLRFIQIFCSNLDEFFMIRVGSLHDKMIYDPKERENKTNMTAKEQLCAISAKVSELLPIKDAVYSEIMQELAEYGVEYIPTNSLTSDEDAYLKAYFNKEIRPLLFTGIVDKKHPIPFLRSGGVYIACRLKKKNTKQTETRSTLAVLPVPENLPHIVFLPSFKTSSPKAPTRFVMMEEIICRYAKHIWKNFEIMSKCIFRVTRNADIPIDEGLYDHDVDFRDIMAKMLKKRKKLSPIRLEIQTSCSDANSSELAVSMAKLLDIRDDYVFNQSSPLTMNFISNIEAALKEFPDLFYKPITPCSSPEILRKIPIINQIKQHDIMLNYPYESINQFIRLLEEAAENPCVRSIKITLYRVARDSKIINALIRAAENGKDVLALVELRARFDEENNIGWSKQLEDAGVTVIYGLEELKVHSKLLLITLREGNDISYITQVGTGNYNERTSRLYTDFSLMTADKTIGSDASVVFNALMVSSAVESTNKLLVAPKGLKSRIVELIDNEITYGSEGYIGIKINSLTDRDLIEKLAEASRAGVTVQLIVRGICCLIPGVKNETENIRVISIVGRLLEHSRIYIFGKADREQIYISSADFMTRNTERRIEVASPLLDKKIASEVRQKFDIMMNDNVKARELFSDGQYRRVPTDPERLLNSQEYFLDKAKKAEQTAVQNEADLSVPIKVRIWKVKR